MSKLLQLVAGAAVVLVPLVPGTVWGQVNPPSPANGINLSNPGNNAQTGILVSPGINPPNNLGNTVPVLVNPPTPATGTTLAAPGSNVQTGVQTIRGVVPPSPGGNQGNPGSSSVNPGTGNAQTGANGTGTGAGTSSGSSGNGLAVPGNVIQLGPGTGNRSGNNLQSNGAIRTEFVPLFPAPVISNDRNTPAQANRNSGSNRALITQSSTVTPNRTLLGATPGTLDQELQAATCAQNWRGAIQIVDRALTAASPGQVTYRNQLRAYRGQLQTLLNARAYVPNWTQQCTKG